LRSQAVHQDDDEGAGKFQGCGLGACDRVGGLADQGGGDGRIDVGADRPGSRPGDHLLRDPCQFCPQGGGGG
jgi:hypothetical protein